MNGLSNNNNNYSNEAVGFCGALTLIFITLKLCKVIDWAWKWVLAPLWIPGLIVIAFVVIVLIVSATKRW